MSRLWQKEYIGLTGGPFRTRVKEHLLSYIQQNQNTKFSRHILECHHSAGPTESIMQVVQDANKRASVNVSDDFYCYKAKCKSSKSNDKVLRSCNRIFEPKVEDKHERTTRPSSYNSQ